MLFLPPFFNLLKKRDEFFSFFIAIPIFLVAFRVLPETSPLILEIRQTHGPYVAEWAAPLRKSTILLGFWSRIISPPHGDQDSEHQSNLSAYRG